MYRSKLREVRGDEGRDETSQKGLSRGFRATAKKKKKKWAGCIEVFPPRFTKKS